MSFAPGLNCASLIALLFLTIESFAQAPVLLSDTTKIYQFDRTVEVLVDSAGSTSFEDIISPKYQQLFKSGYESFSFGYQRSPVWLKIQTSTNRPDRQWYLELPSPFLEYVDVYEKDGDAWRQFRSGYFVKQSEKLIPHTSHVFPIIYDNQQRSTTYVKIYGRSPKVFQILAMDKDRWDSKVRWEDVSYGVFFGILFVMFFYNLFIYLSLRVTSYLLYICTIICTIFIFACAAGYAPFFLWPEHPGFNFYAGRLTLPFLTTFLALFSIRFLEVQKYSKTMYYMLLGLIPVSVIAILLVITDVLSSAGNNLISVSVVLLLVTGIVCRIKGNKMASYYIAAWTIYMTGGLLLTLRNSGFFPFNFWTTHFVEIGAASETVIIALALAAQYRRLKIEKEEAQQLALTIQTDAKEKLEINVRERTHELHKTLERNQEQTKIIENKNAELDSFFYRISHDLKGPISSLLGLSNLALSEVKDERATFYLEKQQQQIHRLSAVINGLIKLTKLHDANLEKQTIDMNTLIDGCISSFNALPNYGKITFTKKLPSELELVSEWTLLNAIFQNLIENAIKYSKADAPFVHVEVYKKDDLLTISVEDNGVGIPLEHQEKIFEMFYRASTTSNGTGLGLYILKRSVDRLNGSIHLESKEGVGSTFTVKLPC